MKRLFGVTGAVFAVKVVTGFAIVATVAAAVTEITISGAINRAGWSRHVNHGVTLATEQGQVVSEAPRAGSGSSVDLSARTPETAEPNSQAGPEGSGASQASGKVSPPEVTTDAEPSDPPMAAVETKFIPKP